MSKKKQKTKERLRFSAKPKHFHFREIGNMDQDFRSKIEESLADLFDATPSDRISDLHRNTLKSPTRYVKLIEFSEIPGTDGGFGFAAIHVSPPVYAHFSVDATNEPFFVDRVMLVSGRNEQDDDDEDADMFQSEA